MKNDLSMIFKVHQDEAAGSVVLTVVSLTIHFSARQLHVRYGSFPSPEVQKFVLINLYSVSQLLKQVFFSLQRCLSLAIAVLVLNQILLKEARVTYRTSMHHCMLLIQLFNRVAGPIRNSFPKKCSVNCGHVADKEKSSCSTAVDGTTNVD